MMKSLLLLLALLVLLFYTTRKVLGAHHCQPASPLTWSSVENVAAAISPEQPVLTT
jgi:hypothetical protein